MRKAIVAALAAASLFGGAATAKASPILECERVAEVTNITARNVSCSDARSFARKLRRQGMPRGSGWIRVPGWKVYFGRYRESVNTSQADLRATRANKVIRFQYRVDVC